MLKQKKLNIQVEGTASIPENLLSKRSKLQNETTMQVMSPTVKEHALS